MQLLVLIRSGVVLQKNPPSSIWHEPNNDNITPVSCVSFWVTFYLRTVNESTSEEMNIFFKIYLFYFDFSLTIHLDSKTGKQNCVTSVLSIKGLTAEYLTWRDHLLKDIFQISFARYKHFYLYFSLIPAV